MINFHDKPIFYHNDEDMDTFYALQKRQKEPRHTFERTFTLLKDSYEVILKNLLANELLMLPKSSSYGNIFSDIYYSYHQCSWS